MNTNSTDSSAKQEILFSLIRQEREEPLWVTGEQSSDSPQIGIREDEHVSFVLRVPNQYHSPTLWIQDIGIQPAEIIPSGDQTKYVWSATKQLFLNHFGWSKLNVALQNEEGLQNFYCCIEVFATKLNEAQTRGMLHYLVQFHASYCGMGSIISH